MRRQGAKRVMAHIKCDGGEAPLSLLSKIVLWVLVRWAGHVHVIGQVRGEGVERDHRGGGGRRGHHAGFRRHDVVHVQGHLQLSEVELLFPFKIFIGGMFPGDCLHT